MLHKSKCIQALLFAWQSHHQPLFILIRNHNIYGDTHTQALALALVPPHTHTHTRRSSLLGWIRSLLSRGWCELPPNVRLPRTAALNISARLFWRLIFVLCSFAHHFVNYCRGPAARRAFAHYMYEMVLPACVRVCVCVTVVFVLASCFLLPPKLTEIQARSHSHSQYGTCECEFRPT